ncbi:hypothetical protein B0T21DRAFT_411208 [Apiosordaria backusii]|uniref:NAD(P)-binding protein n=1 Tax=Apiosordaria backusii TaxID=314023 RepID=A0AA40BKV6_9PEZI|nr:hypothetical protein B0T21DRAFT_411208 [Apiosordaria backusii]
MSPQPPKTYLITGTTSGIGLALVKELLSQQQNVIATGRNVSARFPPDLVSSHPNSLKLLELDITSPLPTLQQKATEAWGLFPGGVDVLFNNAGMSAMKSCEEASEEYITQMFNRERERGCGGVHLELNSLDPLPFMSHYAASKAALSTYIESLDKEVSGFGIKVVGFECGGCVTNLGQPRDTNHAAGLLEQQTETVYGEGLGRLVGMFMRDAMAYMPGDSAKVAKVMVETVEKLRKGEEKVPVRLVLGSDAWESVKQKVEETGKVLETWREVSWGTDREGVRGGAESDYLRAVSIL